MRRRAALAGLVAALLAAAPAGAAEEDPFAGLEPVDADAFVSLFREVCLAALPGFGTVAGVLGRSGFGAPDVAGFRLHERRAFAAMALAAGEAPPSAAPTCMVMAPDVPFPAARDALMPLIEARAEELSAAEADGVDLRHRIWRWQEGGRTVQLVLSRDGKGHLGAVLAMPPAGGGS